jgi:hypothetical protein
MKESSWYLKIGFGLIAFSVIFYTAQIMIFHDERDTFFYMLQDLAFVPVSVLFVTLILDRLLKKREKQALLNKMNMVIGVFFNEIGTDLIRIFGGFIPDIGKLNAGLQISADWKENDFNKAGKSFAIKPEQFVPDEKNLIILKEFLEKRKDGLLKMLANPNLLEHDTFTNLLWAVFHVADELAHRQDFSNLPKADAAHLRGDMVRAYTLIIYEWAAYMKHLKNDYPYLFSLAVRTNPFNPEAEVTVYEQ